MVNAPQMWRNKRLYEISVIQESIREGLKKGNKPDYEKLILSTMSGVGISRKTATEYVDMALYNEGLEIDGK